MNTPVASAQEPKSKASAEALLREVLRARATTLARQGRMHDAVNLIGAAPGGLAGDPECLDLLARIRAQAGEWTEAERLWLQLLSVRPEHAGAQAALTRLRAQRQKAVNWAPVASGALVALLLFGAWLLSQRTAERHTATLAELRGELAQRDQEHVRRVRDERMALDSRLAALAVGQQAMEARLAAAAQQATPKAKRPLQLGFAVEGTLQHAQGEDLWLWFATDPLGTRAQPTRAGGARLRALARAIARSQERVRVEVLGLVAEGRAVTHEVQALRRAGNVARALQASGVLPPRAVVAMAVPVVQTQAWQGPPAALRGAGALVLRVSRVNDATATPTN